MLNYLVFNIVIISVFLLFKMIKMSHGVDVGVDGLNIYLKNPYYDVGDDGLNWSRH